MIKSINTKEESCFVTVSAEHRGNTTITFVDDLLDTRTRLATYVGGKWKFSSPNKMNDLIILAKQNPKIKRAIIDCLDFMDSGEELPSYITLKCLLRRVKLKIDKVSFRLELWIYKVFFK